MKQVKPEELKEWIRDEKPFTLIDVRELWEHEMFNIGGIHIPMGELSSRKKEIDGDMPVVIYCEKGIRSVIAIQRLEGFGFHNLINLQGGMAAWKKLAQ
jgi:rhodanese-related sulfurtransferase